MATSAHRTGWLITRARPTRRLHQQWYLTQAKRVYQSSCPACHELPTVESIKAFASDADTVDMAVAMAEGAALKEEDTAKVVRYLLALRHDTAP